MTTINEFYQQKRGIEIEVAEMITMPMQPYSSSEELDKSLRMYQHGITMLLGELQPPRPTCDTCKMFNLELWEEKDGDGDISFCENRIIDCSPKFGCIEHSDYGDAK